MLTALWPKKRARGCCCFPSAPHPVSERQLAQLHRKDFDCKKGKEDSTSGFSTSREGPMTRLGPKWNILLVAISFWISHWDRISST